MSNRINEIRRKTNEENHAGKILKKYNYDAKFFDKLCNLIQLAMMHQPNPPDGKNKTAMITSPLARKYAVAIMNLFDGFNNKVIEEIKAIE